MLSCCHLYCLTYLFFSLLRQGICQKRSESHVARCLIKVCPMWMHFHRDTLIPCPSRYLACWSAGESIRQCFTASCSTCGCACSLVESGQNASSLVVLLLQVASFYAPVYYSFLQHPGALVFYLTSTTVLGEFNINSISASLLDAGRL